MYKVMFKRMLKSEHKDGNIEHIEHIRPLTRYSVARPPTITRPKTSKFHRSVTYSAPSLWASLPNEVKLLDDPDKFDSAVRKLVQTELETLPRI